MDSLSSLGDLVKATEFIGQSSGLLAVFYLLVQYFRKYMENWLVYVILFIILYVDLVSADIEFPGRIWEYNHICETWILYFKLGFSNTLSTY